MTMRTYITVKATFTALHRWADCPFEEVAFLRNFHRHVFHVELTIRVKHLQRNVEFFMLQRELDAFLMKWQDGKWELSCEEFAKETAGYFANDYSVARCTVSEDGENSATVLVSDA